MRSESQVTWMVSSELPNELRKAEDAARSQSALDRELSIETQFVRGGVLRTDIRLTQIGDFFSEVKVQDLERGFSLDFYPARNADPYWRDVMVRILIAIRESANGISIKRIERVA
jgi:hypothetical protein